MKLRILLSICLFLMGLVAFAQEPPLIRVGAGIVIAGSGDIPGANFLLGAQKQVSNWSMFELLASGTYIERTTHYGQGYKLEQKSNGVALEATYNLTWRLGRFSLYPAAGPVLRYAHETRLSYVGINRDSQGMITKFSTDIRDENGFQAGYVLAANLDGQISKRIALGLRASVQSFYSGQKLASLGLTFKNARWRL